MWDWTLEDQHQWLTANEGVNALYSAWVDQAVDAFSRDPMMHERMPASHDAAWFRSQLERYRVVFCGSPDAPLVREASRAVGFAHIKAHVLPSWYVGLYNLIFDAYHALEQQRNVPSLPTLTLVRRRWLADVKTVLDTYDVAMAGKIEALSDLALTDPLTGLLNRRGFWDRVTYDVDHGIHNAVFILIDIDRFKTFNDTHGHPAGDLILQTFADLCRTAVPPNSALSRLGGDEFAWWVVNPPSLDVLRQRLASIASICRAEHHLTFSAGLARHPRDGSDINPLYTAADSALYRAKHGGRNRFALPGVTDLYPLTVS